MLDYDSVECLNGYFAALINGIRLGIPSLGKADRAGIYAHLAIPLGLAQKVSVTVKEDRVARDGWKIVGGIFVPMRHKEGELFVAVIHEGGVRKNREGEYHLIDLGVAIASYAKKLVSYGVEQFDDRLGRVAVGEIVSWTVI